MERFDFPLGALASAIQKNVSSLRPKVGGTQVWGVPGQGLGLSLQEISLELTLELPAALSHLDFFRISF